MVDASDNPFDYLTLKEVLKERLMTAGAISPAGEIVDANKVKKVSKGFYRDLTLAFHPDRFSRDDRLMSSLNQAKEKLENGLSDDDLAGHLVDLYVGSGGGDDELLAMAMQEIDNRDTQIERMHVEIDNTKAALIGQIRGRVHYRPEQVELFRDGSYTINLSNARQKIAELRRGVGSSPDLERTVRELRGQLNNQTRRTAQLTTQLGQANNSNRELQVKYAQSEANLGREREKVREAQQNYHRAQEGCKVLESRLKSEKEDNKRTLDNAQAMIECHKKSIDGKLKNARKRVPPLVQVYEELEAPSVDYGTITKLHHILPIVAGNNEIKAVTFALSSIISKEGYQLLRTLKKQGIVTAAYSNTTMTGDEIKAQRGMAGINRYLDKVFTYGDTGVKKQENNPGAYQKMAFELKKSFGFKSAREAILHIGSDIKTDYQGALNAGLRAAHLIKNR